MGFNSGFKGLSYVYRQVSNCYPGKLNYVPRRWWYLSTGCQGSQLRRS